jgi:SNF2 family DNA or RNA helicase
MDFNQKDDLFLCSCQQFDDILYSTTDQQMALAELRILENELSRELRQLKRKRKKLTNNETDTEFEHTLMEQISRSSLSPSERSLPSQQKEVDFQKHKEEKETKRLLSFNEREDEEGVHFAGGYRLSSEIWKQLYPHQQTGVRWLWELHRQETGGIVADEMGLGKTVQVIAFLTGLVQSNLINAETPPILLVCPATLLEQWRTEFSLWGPDFNVILLHRLGLQPSRKRQHLENADSDSTSWDSDSNDMMWSEDVVSDPEDWKPQQAHVSNTTSQNSQKRRYSSPRDSDTPSSFYENIHRILDCVCRPPSGSKH